MQLREESILYLRNSFPLNKHGSMVPLTDLNNPDLIFVHSRVVLVGHYYSLLNQTKKINI